MHTLVLLGELDRASAATLETAIERLCDSEVAGITLDLSKLTYIDTTGVAVIAFRCRWCQARGYGFALVPGSRFVQQAFEQVGGLERLPFLAPHAQDAARTPAPDDPTAAPGSPEDVYVDAGARTESEAPGATRARSITLLRISGRRARSRRARRARGRR
jgi:anti-anti-sigma factor